MPGPKSQTMEPPSRSSTVVGTNQDEMPGPVAIACQTSSGVPGTSTSASTERRPEASFFTGMMAPPFSPMRLVRQRVRHDHQAMRAAARGRFIVVARDKGRHGFG